MATLNLLPAQISHVNNLSSILKDSPCALDMSSLGSGKTYASSYIALRDATQYKHIIVIAPVSVKVKWLQMTKEYKLPMAAALSYSEVRGVKNKQPKHGLLNRRDYTVQMRDPREPAHIWHRSNQDRLILFYS